MHERDILKIKAIRSKDIYDWAAFKKARNSVNNEACEGSLLHEGFS